MKICKSANLGLSEYIAPRTPEAGVHDWRIAIRHMNRSSGHSSQQGNVRDVVTVQQHGSEDFLSLSNFIDLRTRSGLLRRESVSYVPLP
jgi:hypothetical protein